MRKIDELLMADTFDATITKLEAFGDYFEHLATTGKQRELAREFNAFVGELIQLMLPQSAKLHGHETWSDVFKEMRGDEAAGKHEDAHWYGDEAVLENHNVTGFKAQAAQRGRQPGEGYPVIHYEDPDGSLHQWADLSAAGKLEYIALDAVYWDVPFKAFAEVARDVIGGDTDAALQLAFEHQKELHGLAKLLPDDGRIEPTAMIDQLKEMLAYVAKLEAKEEEREHDKETLFNAGCDAPDRKPLDGAKALKDILRGDYPKQKEAKTKDNGREI